MRIKATIQNADVLLPEELEDDDQLTQESVGARLYDAVALVNAVSSLPDVATANAYPARLHATLLSLNARFAAYAERAANAETGIAFRALDNKAAKFANLSTSVVAAGDKLHARQRTVAVETLHTLYDALTRELVTQLSKYGVVFRESVVPNPNLDMSPVANFRLLTSDLMFAPEKTNIAQQTLDQFEGIQRFFSYDNAKNLHAKSQRILAIRRTYLDSIGEDKLHATMQAAGGVCMAKHLVKHEFPGCRLYWLLPLDTAEAFREGVGVQYWDFVLPDKSQD